MTGRSREAAERPSEQSLSVRPAKAEDLDAFLELARLCVAESCQPFSEDEARYVFAGIARADPAIHLLLAGAEAIGFLIVRCGFVPLTRVASVRQELVYVRAERRSSITEGLLHAMTISVFKATKQHHEISLYVGASPHAFEVIKELRQIGFREVGLRMEAVREEDGVPVGGDDRLLN